VLIETSKGLLDLVEITRREAPANQQIRIALDTEADSFHSYREKLCLIQFGANGRYAVIDPLKVEDFQPLQDLMAESEIWFHGSDYDLALWRRTFSQLPHFVWDTQIAAQLVGSTRFGLAALLEEHFDVKLAKESQRADWGKRPLTDEMVEYAINDVRYLLPLADLLLAKLDGLGRREWFVESCRGNLMTAAERQDKDPQGAWRIKGWGKLRPRGWAYLRELWRWRDREAAALDKPAFRLLPNGKMLYLAERLQEGRGCRLIGKYSEMQKESFQEAVDRARDLADDELPRRNKGSGKGRVSDLAERIEPFKKSRDALASELGLEPSLLASRALMEEIVLDPEVAEKKLLPWQFGLLSGEIVKLPVVSRS